MKSCSVGAWFFGGPRVGFNALFDEAMRKPRNKNGNESGGMEKQNKDGRKPFVWGVFGGYRFRFGVKKIPYLAVNMWKGWSLGLWGVCLVFIVFDLGLKLNI